MADEPLLRSLDGEVLRDSDRLDALLEASSRPIYRSHEYVETVDDVIFILHGDQKRPDELRGFPVYVAGTEGDRIFEGTAYRKVPIGEHVSLGEVLRDENDKDDMYTASSMRADSSSNTGIEVWPHRYDVGSPRAQSDTMLPTRYRPDPVEEGVYRFPPELVRSHIKPRERTDAAVEGLGSDIETIYQEIADVIEQQGAEPALLGSQLLGMETDDSDIDIAVFSDEDVLDAIYEEMEGREEVEMATLEHHHTVSSTYTEQVRYGTREVSMECDISKEGQQLIFDGTTVDLLQVHDEVFTDYSLPSWSDDWDRIEDVSVTVTDAGQGHYTPAVYEIEVDDEGYDLVSFLPTFTNSLEKGDAVAVTGCLYKDRDTIYLVDEDDYVTASSGLLSMPFSDSSPDRLDISTQK